MMKIVLAGPGLMGSQIGCELAIGGHEVAFLPNQREAGERRVQAAFALATTLDLWPTEVIEVARGLVSFLDSIESCDPATEFFIESIIEDAEPKIALLRSAARQLPDAILASNTSSISIGVLGDGCGAPQRTIGMHFWNPPLIMPLVEVISGPNSRPDIVERAAALVREIGKRPMIVDRDVPGFVWNRLQFALLREAVWIVENGVAAPGVVDEIVRDGLARRWRYTGPFATAALGGPATFTNVANNLWPVLSTAPEVHDLARWLPSDASTLGEIRATRDAGLLRDLKAERE
jgi:3-hydroxybutyryl-CoA dehydrogenase